MAAACAADTDNPAVSTAVLLERAAAAEAAGELNTAYALYLKATQGDPESSEAWAAFGEHLRFYVHDPAAARNAFERSLSCVDRTPHASAFAWRGLGEIESKASHNDAAIGFFQKSLAAMPLSDTHRSLCHLYCMQGDYRSAAEHARAAVEMNPQDPIARLLYAAQLQRAGEAAAGREEFRRAFALVGDGPVHCCVYYNAAGYLGVCGDKAGAIDMLERFFKTPNHRHLTRQEIEHDSDFAALKDSAAFRALLDTYSH